MEKKNHFAIRLVKKSIIKQMFADFSYVFW